MSITKCNEWHHCRRERYHPWWFVHIRVGRSCCDCLWQIFIHHGCFNNMNNQNLQVAVTVSSMCLSSITWCRTVKISRNRNFSQKSLALFVQRPRRAFYPVRNVMFLFKYKYGGRQSLRATMVLIFLLYYPVCRTVLVQGPRSCTRCTQNYSTVPYCTTCTVQ